MDSSSAGNSETSGFSFWELVFWAGMIVGLILLFRYLSKAGAGAPALASATVAAVPFSPWFPLR